jgi:hypothetical protein
MLTTLQHRRLPRLLVRLVTAYPLQHRRLLRLLVRLATAYPSAALTFTPVVSEARIAQSVLSV